MQSKTASQAFKQYVERLSKSGLPTCQAKLNELAELGRVGAFQWFLANKFDTVSAATPTSTVDAFLADVAGDEDDDYQPALVAEEPAKPARRTRKARASKPAAEEKLYTFKSGLYARYGIEPTIGHTFKSKSGGTFKVVAIELKPIAAVTCRKVS